MAQIQLFNNPTLTRSAIALVLVGIVINFFVSRLAGRNKKRLPLPPGPPGLPIIGNAHQLVGKSIVAVLDKWAQEYGPLVHVRLFGTSVIVISSTAVARDLMEARHQNYSGRPNFLLASDAMQGGMMMPFIHANERFRRVRKLLTTEMRTQAVVEYFNPVQTHEIQRLVKSLIESPSDWKALVARAIASIIMTSVYDKPIKSGDEAGDAVANVNRLNDELVAAIDAGKNYVDFLPWMRYVPFAPYKKPALDYYNLAENTYRYLMDEAKENLAAGKKANSVAARLLEKQADIEADYREQYWALGSFYLAGSDTQSVSTQIVIMALALHPHVMAKAQAEVDRVVGPDRLPTYADEAELPYIKGIMREAWRWRPVGPTAIPHASVNDDEYNGYFIPGGSFLIPNIWTMHMDPTVFDKPEIFEPQRYVDNPMLPGHVFGFGRRVCPGQKVAEHTLFLEIATIAWALNITKATDPSTKQTIPIDCDRDRAFKPGGVMKPHPFSVSITPRSAHRTKLLQSAVDADDQ